MKIKASEAVPGQWYESVRGIRMLCVSVKSLYTPDIGLFPMCDDDDLICLPGCTGWDWQPPKPEKRYRAFANAEEFKPHRDRWIKRHCKGGAFRVIDYSSNHVYMHPSESEGCAYQWMFDAGYHFEDGEPFGVEVSE